MYSTLTAVLEATNDWYLNIDNGSLNDVLSLARDLRKAFDTVDQYILLEKLKLYGEGVFRQILVRIYEALILHYFDYYSKAWACLANCLSDRL